LAVGLRSKRPLRLAVRRLIIGNQKIEMLSNFSGLSGLSEELSLAAPTRSRGGSLATSTYHAVLHRRSVRISVFQFFSFSLRFLWLLLFDPFVSFVVPPIRVYLCPSVVPTFLPDY
jgi:hypothetical protein